MTSALDALGDEHSHPPSDLSHHIIAGEDGEEDEDTASQRSVSLSSAHPSPRHSLASDHTPVSPIYAPVLAGFAASVLPVTSSNATDTGGGSTTSTAAATLAAGDPPLDTHAADAKRASHPSTLDTDFSSEADSQSLFHETFASSMTSAPPSVHNGDHDDTGASIGKKERPESLLVSPTTAVLVHGVALVDFNHLVGPKIEYSRGAIFRDEEISKILPFFALPDGAHLSSEDYCYFHLVPSGPHPRTIFGISCNMQIATSKLIVKDVDVTRSIVQKAVVVLTTEPAFGPMRDKLGVVTRALFNQLDFRETEILRDFHVSLETSLKTQMTESALYMGTSLRQFLHHFRHRALVLLKALMLQKRIMFYGHPVERLCTYQYSLVSLIPNLLQTLQDCGSPPLAARAQTLSRPTELRTSERKSMMRYLGMPLDLFGMDAFFQPYLPLQQLDMIKESKSWLCGTTNTIVAQQKEVDLLVNIETGAFEFRDPKLERMAGLSPADRKWIDDLVRDVNEGWDDADPARVAGMQFKGSDDYLRTKFEEYISAALASVRYRDFVAKGEGAGVIITGGSGGDANSLDAFNPLWCAEFKRTNAYDVWDRTTDPMLFDIVEPRHPCIDKPSVVADIGLRLAEGIQELKIEQQLAPTREAISRTISAGSTGLLKAVEGVRGRWAVGRMSSASSSDISVNEIMSPPVTPSPSEGAARREKTGSPTVGTPVRGGHSPLESIFGSSARPPSVASTMSSGTNGPGPTAGDAKAKLASWGAGIGSFFGKKVPRLSVPIASAPTPSSITVESEKRTHSLPVDTTALSPAPVSADTPVTALRHDHDFPGSESSSSLSASVPSGENSLHNAGREGNADSSLDPVHVGSVESFRTADGGSVEGDQS